MSCGPGVARASAMSFRECEEPHPAAVGRSTSRKWKRSVGPSRTGISLRMTSLAMTISEIQGLYLRH